MLFKLGVFKMSKVKICMVMVGGGDGVFIGVIYWIVVWLDGMIEFVVGVFSLDVNKCKVIGELFGFDSSCCYDSY